MKIFRPQKNQPVNALLLPVWRK